MYESWTFFSVHILSFSKEVTFNEEASDIASDEAEMSDVGSDFDGSFDDEQSFAEEETKSRFTNYSMTSSVIRRNDGLTLIDDRFEKVGFHVFCENSLICIWKVCSLSGVGEFFFLIW